jgi:hypothetical protein
MCRAFLRLGWGVARIANPRYRAFLLFGDVGLARIANPRYRFGTDCKTARSGFIYIDADNADAIPESPYILASRKSLSDTGFRILVKVDNLTADNYADVDPSVAAMPNVQKINDMRLSSQ